MPFALLIFHFLLVLFHVNWKFSCGLLSSKILILICHDHIISFFHAPNVLLYLLTPNFRYQHLNLSQAFYKSCSRTYSTIHCQCLVLVLTHLYCVYCEAIRYQIRNMKKGQKQGRDERKQEHYQTSESIHSRCPVVFLRSFISALFLSFFQHCRSLS